jgi:hypothetical protein
LQTFALVEVDRVEEEKLIREAFMLLLNVWKVIVEVNWNIRREWDDDDEEVEMEERKENQRKYAEGTANIHFSFRQNYSPQMTGMDDCMASMENRGRSLSVDRGHFEYWHPVAAVVVAMMERIHCENSVEMMTDIDLVVAVVAAGNSSNFDSL